MKKTITFELLTGLCDFYVIFKTIIIKFVLIKKVRL